MFDHEFTKYEIATYLRECEKMMFYASNNDNIEFFRLFALALHRDNKSQYAIMSHYNEMLDIYEIVLLMRILTGVYDNYIEFFKDETIESLDIPTDFILTDRKFTKKHIITCLRNAFNHVNDPKKNSYRIIRVNEDGKSKIKLEVLYNPGGQIPVHAIIGIDRLKKICLEIFKNNKAELVPYIDINNMEESILDNPLRKYYIGKDMSELNKNNLLESLNSDTKRDSELLFLENGMSYEDYYYTDEQDAKIKKDLKWWGDLKISGFKVINHLLRKVMPFPCLKDKAVLLNLIVVDKYARRVNGTYLELKKAAYRIAELDTISKNSPLYPYSQIFERDMNMFYETLDIENVLSITSSIYYGYLFDNLVEDEFVKLGTEQEIKKENLVKAFYNLSWYIGRDDNYKILDWDSEEKYYSKSKEFLNIDVSFENMRKCAELYYNNGMMSKEENSKFMDIPIHIMVDKQKDGEKKQMGISCIKNDIYYYYSIKNVHLKVCGEDQQQRFANSDEIDFFIKELDNLTYEERKENKKLIEEVIENLLFEKEERIKEEQEEEKIMKL